MAAPREEKPHSFSDFVDLIEGLQKNKKTPLWFRGSGKDNYKLLPSLYRHPTITQISEFERLENELITRYKQRSIPYHDRGSTLTNNLDTLFFMQHYGVPTRLLDWTESSLIGLYFAVMKARYTLSTTGRPSITQPAAVWILDPFRWNRHSLKHQSYDGGVLVPGDDQLKGYQTISSVPGMLNPVALYGAHNSSRIVAQRGVFTIFGQNTKPMEELYDTDFYPADSLIKVTITRRYLPAIRRSLLNHGITESVVFPDLDGLSREIKRTFGFEV